LDTYTVMMILLAYLFASFLKGVTGLGFSTICLPLLSYIIDPKIGITLILLPSISSNLIVMFQVGHFIETCKRFWRVYLFVLPGLMLGVFTLSRANSDTIRLALGLVLVLYSSWALIAKEHLISKRTERLISYPVGFATGLVNGFTGSQIMPILPYMLSLKLHKDIFVQAVNISFTLSSFTLIILLRKYDLLAVGYLGTSIGGIVVVFAGVFLGGKVRKILPEKRYKQIVLAFLFLIGLSLIIKPFVT